MKNIISLLFLFGLALNGQTIVEIDSLITQPSGCINEAELVAHEFNVLNTDSSIVAFAYVDLSTAFTYSSNEAITIANVGGSFEIVDDTYTFYRTRVAQICKIDCCNKVIKWSDWVFGSSMSPVITTVDDNIPILTGVETTIDVTSNDTSSYCEPISYIVLNETNSTVINNENGTFNVIAINSDWSFDYIAICNDNSTSDTSTVTGILIPIKISITAVNDTIETSEVGIVSSVDVTLNDTSSDCEPITYVVSNELNVTVVNNNGTFDVTPIAAGSWSYDYTATCSDGVTSDLATVSGNAGGNGAPVGSACTTNISLSNQFLTSCSNALSTAQNQYNGVVYTIDSQGECTSSLTNQLFVGENYQFSFGLPGSNYSKTIDWGDGATESYNQIIYHTYTSPGVYTIAVYLDCDSSLIGSMTVTVS